MLKRLLTLLLIPAFACTILSAQEVRPTHLHQPTLTPQNSGITNGLIAVWPVNPPVVWRVVAPAPSPSPPTVDRPGEPV